MKVSQEWLFGRIEEFLAQGQDVEVMIEGISMNPLLRSGKDAVVLSSVNCCRHCERSSPEHNLNKVPNLVKVKVKVQPACRPPYSSRPSAFASSVHTPSLRGTKQSHCR